MDNVSNEILLRLHFRELALRYLDQTNPQPNRAIVIADAICSYDGPFEENRPMRYEAHDFFHEALKLIEFKQPLSSGRRFNQWLHTWNLTFGVG